MKEAVLFKLLDMALNAAAVGIEREAILNKVRVLQDAGRNLDEIAEELRKMREQAIAGAQGEIDKA